MAVGTKDERRLGEVEHLFQVRELLSGRTLMRNQILSSPAACEHRPEMGSEASDGKLFKVA